MNNIRKCFQSKLIKNGLWLFVLQVFNTIAPMLTLPYITRILGPSGYGDFSIALNWVLYFQVIVEYGFAYWGARAVATGKEKNLQEIYSQIITARIFLMIISFGLMIVIYEFSGRPIKHLICMSILFSMVFGVAFQLTWLFQGMQNMKLITIVNVISRTISLLLVFVLIKNSNDVYLYCFLYSCTYLISGCIGMILANRLYGLRFKLCNAKQVLVSLRDAWPLFVSQAMSKVLSGFGVTVLGMMATNSIVGIYSAIYKIPYTMTLFFAPISQALYPDISVSFSHSKDNGMARVKKFSKLIIPFFGVAAIAIMLLHNIIVKILFGQEYASYSSLIIPLCLWFLFSVINNFLGIQTLVGSGHQKEYSRSFSISAVVAIFLNIAMGKVFSLYGIALATLAGEVILSLLLIKEIKTKLK